ncbi:PEBP-like protein [Alternaria alternata]|nr:PEBP-like protein [Alternaria alternata]
MYFSTSVLVAGLVSLAQAQVPSGFTPQAATKLEVIFNSTMVNTAGQQLARASVATQPQLALSSAMIDSSQTYMFVMLDLDVPPANGSTERRVLLHCMNTGFKATKQQLMGAATLLASSEKGPAAYIPPGPPATDTVAHRYVQLLFQQPASLNIQASAFAGAQARIGFDIESFMSKNGVSAPVAGNFFRVDGRIAATASGTAGAAGASGTGAMPTGTPQPFTGAAGEVSVPYGTAGLLSGIALFVLLVL